jgi:hypothetical protein
MPKKASLALSAAIMLLSVWGVVSAWHWPAKAALFPLVISIPLFFLAAAEALWVLLGSETQSAASDFKLSDHLPESVALRRTLLAAGWIFGFFFAILLLGFLVAVPAFVFLYLRLQGKQGWLFSAVFTLAVFAFFYGLFDLLLHLPFPPGVLLSWVGVR